MFFPFTRVLISASVALILFANSAKAEAPKGPKEGLTDVWASFWDDCYDLNLPYFQSRIKKFISMLQAGSAWEKAVEVEKLNINKLNNEVCRKWGQSKNGDENLKEFLSQLTLVANTAIALKGQIVNDIGKQMEAWMKVEQQELDPYGFKLTEFPCGKAFQRTEEAIQNRLAELEQKVLSIREECSKSGDKAIAEAIAAGLSPVTKTFGQGSGKIVPRGSSKNGASDITGIDEAKKKEMESAAKLKQQEEEAAEKNKKKQPKK